MGYWNRDRGGKRPGGEVEIDFYVERDEEEIELQIKGHVSAYDPGKTYGPPDRCYPPEGGEVEVHSVLHNGESWEGVLTREEESDIEEAMSQANDDHYEWLEDEAAEARMELAKERKMGLL
jgi:hypothetical protein